MVCEEINQLAGKPYFKGFLQNNLQNPEVRLQNSVPILYNSDQYITQTTIQGRTHRNATIIANSKQPETATNSHSS
jgi:hypothetical protein